ncbi:hypothetical protein PQD69_gp058 [Carnobacterium phage cd4]|uniref:Uncharacterized protein n=1 Tax=Carnobacterium phage cd4 TaxID=2849246 RepID=A0AAE7VHV3_9CAUD|nr:hypothetical protein PQD69_gp058 [Carnobacterium phage cd4]QXP45344.1 hypothetical protein cd4_058 [Carnobacterium phage cd4]
MEKLKFEVGDMVILTEKSDYNHTKGDTLEIIEVDVDDPEYPYYCQSPANQSEDWVSEDHLLSINTSEALQNLNQELVSNNNELVEKLKEADKTIEKLQDNLDNANLTIKALEDDVRCKNLELQAMDTRLRRFRELSDSMYNLAVANIQY